MTIRQELEAREHAWLSPCATRSTSDGALRDDPISEDTLRTAFQRDRDRILHSKSFRRLKHKTQCFLAPEGDHYRTRLTHTLEVSQIARTIARALMLNEDLTEAIALGHDLGHTPFGHMGERILNRIVPGGFEHRDQSLRVVEVLEKDGSGLNLTRAVRDGIHRHSGPIMPLTPEGTCVRMADRIAYLNHDIDDAQRAGVLHAADLPKAPIAVLGITHGERIERMIADIVKNSRRDEGNVHMSKEMQGASEALRDFLFSAVYMREDVLGAEKKADRLLDALYHHVLDNPDDMPPDYLSRAQEDGFARSAADFVAGMTDRYAISFFERIFVPGVNRIT